MPAKLTASDLLNRDFLEMRCRIIDVAAALDRIHRAGGADSVRSDPRWRQVADAVRLLVDGQPDRATRVQSLFSDSYDPNWQSKRETAGPPPR